MNKGEVKEGIKIKSCDCAHEYQDKVYGQGRRVYNKAGSGLAVKWRCSVCSKVVVS